MSQKDWILSGFIGIAGADLGWSSAKNGYVAWTGGAGFTMDPSRSLIA